MTVVNITPKNICNAIEELLNENERLKQNKKIFETIFENEIEVSAKLHERLDECRNRIEKAIKFINENKCEIELDEYLLCNCLYDKKTIKLLKILEGVDKE